MAALQSELGEWRVRHRQLMPKGITRFLAEDEYFDFNVRNSVQQTGRLGRLIASMAPSETVENVGARLTDAIRNTMPTLSQFIATKLWRAMCTAFDSGD